MQGEAKLRPSIARDISQMEKPYRNTWELVFNYTEVFSVCL